MLKKFFTIFFYAALLFIFTQWLSAIKSYMPQESTAARTSFLQDMLYIAATQGNLQEIDRLLTMKNTVHINALSSYGYTPLQGALLYKQEHVILHLLKNGADIEVSSRQGESSLHIMAHVAGNSAATYTALASQAKIQGLLNIKKPSTLQTALHIACSQANYRVVEELIKTGADTDVRDIDGNTPLHKVLYLHIDIEPYSTEMKRLFKKIISDAQDIITLLLADQRNHQTILIPNNANHSAYDIANLRDENDPLRTRFFSCLKDG